MNTMNNWRCPLKKMPKSTTSNVVQHGSKGHPQIGNIHKSIIRRAIGNALQHATIRQQGIQNFFVKNGVKT